MLRPVALSKPTTPLVTLQEVKRQCVIPQEVEDDDGLLNVYIQTVYDYLNGHTGILGRCLFNQQWRVDMVDWPASRWCHLPFPDVSAIDSVDYWDEDNADQNVASTNFDLYEDAKASRIRFKDSFDFPGVYDDRLDAVRITFTAGYGTKASDVPAAIRAAALLMVCDLYEMRGDVGMGDATAIPSRVGSERLLQPFRRDII